MCSWVFVGDNQLFPCAEKIMEALGNGNRSTETVLDYDRVQELKDFDETKAGVKGLVDAGVVNIPQIFVREPEDLAGELNSHGAQFQVPVIDLIGMRDDRREQIVEEVQIASKTWGFFQVVNHGIPLKVLDEMLKGLRMFNEQDLEVKKEFYSRDRTRQVRFNCNYDLYQSRAANWRDTLTISTFASSNLNPQELPAVCRDAALEYIKHAKRLGETLFELLSEALGLETDHLKAMECPGGHVFVCHYYPSCPEPELTLGTSKHSDPTFLTVLLQDQIGGLQVLHEDRWVDVNPMAGGIVVNIGDLLQILSNDKFKSVEHRVIANRVGPRLSVACFFNGQPTVPPKVYGPIKELTSEENPPLYKEFLVSEYIKNFYSRGLDEKSGLDLFKL